jgi:prefoldin subunit 5
MLTIPPKPIDLATRVDELEEQISILQREKRDLQDQVKQIRQRREYTCALPGDMFWTEI